MAKTHIGRTIESADKRLQYDEQVKRLISNKVILAHILKNTAEEVKNFTIEEIVSCIDRDIKVGIVPVNPGESNQPEIIIGDNVESKVPYEGVLTYDIRFHMYAEKDMQEIKLLINVEAQKDIKRPYHMSTRGIVYGARMISSQIDTEVVNGQYQNLKKVYSIWICMNAPNYIGNAMTKFYIAKKDLVGNVQTDSVHYDKLTVLLIYLNEKKDNNNNDIFHLLNVLLSSERTPAEKEEVLEKQYQIPINYEYRKELGEMCNLGEAIEEKGEQRKLISLICRKIQRNKSIEQIADEVEETVDAIRPYYEAALEEAPEYDEDKIYDRVSELQMNY